MWRFRYFFDINNMGPYSDHGINPRSRQMKKELLNFFKFHSQKITTTTNAKENN